MKIEKTIIVDEDFQGWRLDKFLATEFPDIPRRFFQTEIKNENILVGGKKAKASQKIKQKDKIELNCAYRGEKLELVAQKEIPLEIVFRHPEFLILEKPAGISVHPSFSERKNTLANAILARFPKIEGVGENPLRPGIVHRLDKETSGLLIVALTVESFEFFKKAFSERKIEKEYTAAAWGKFSRKKGRVNFWVGKSRKNPALQAASSNPEKVINPKEALTQYQVAAEKGDQTWLKVYPRTGRKHQIRVHFHALGHPLVGDSKYYSKISQRENRKFDRLFLHASGLKFKYRDGEKYKFSSEPAFEVTEHK